MASSKLDILINAKNNASGTIKQVDGDLKGLEGSTGLAGKAMTALSGVAIAAAIVKLSQLSVEIQSTASQFQMLEAGSQRMTRNLGVDFGDMLQGMRKASGGMIAETDLILAANKAMMLGVADSTEDMVALMNIAGERGQAMGLSMSQAFNDIVTGLGRGSALILDNLGIIVDAEQANRNYAETLGKTASALSDVEKKQALINSVLATSSGNVELMIDPTQELAASWADFKTSISLFVTESTPLPNLLSGVATGIREVNDALAEQRANSAGKAAARAAEWDEGEIQKRIDGIRMMMAPYEEAGQTASAEYKELQKLLRETTGELEGFSSASLAYFDYGLQIADQSIAEQQALQAEIQATSTLLDQIVSKTGQARGAILGSLMGGATSAAGGDPLAGYNLALGTATDIQAELGRIALETNLTYEQAEQFILPQLVAQQNELWTSANKTATSVASISSEYSNLQSTLDSVLSGSLNVGVGVKASDFMPREDDVNENARRLADIMVNGFTGQDWMGEFKSEVPDIFKALTESGDPQAAAASMLKEFEMGLRPELLDKGMAKERVRAMILGQENMSALADEIAGELAAEMGISMYQAQMATGAALGTTDLGQQGAEKAQAFSDGAQSINVGGVFVDTFVTQTKAMHERIKAAGNDAGTQWGNGFMETVGDNVPDALVNTLVSLVTPGVMANISRTDSQTGADGLWQPQRLR